MNVSIFLAKAIGLYMLFISITYLVNKKRFKNLLMNMMNNAELMLITGFIALILGILIVVSHNIWVKDWRIIITIVGWMALMKGVNIILFPEFLINFSKKWIQNNVAYYSTFILTFLIGAVLLYYGYIHS